MEEGTAGSACCFDCHDLWKESLQRTPEELTDLHKTHAVYREGYKYICPIPYCSLAFKVSTYRSRHKIKHGQCSNEKEQEPSDSVAEERCTIEMFGGMFSERDWDKHNYTLHYESNFERDLRNDIPPNVKELWGFDGFDVIRVLEEKGINKKNKKKWHIVYENLTVTNTFKNKLARAQNKKILKNIMKKLIFLADPDHEEVPKRMRTRLPNEDPKTKWGLDPNRVKEIMEKADEDAGECVSWTAAANLVGTPDFRTKTERGHLLKEFMMLAYPDWTVARDETEEAKARGGNPGKRRKLLPGAKPLPPARALKKRFEKQLQENEDQRELIFGKEVVVEEVTTRQRKKNSDTGRYEIDTSNTRTVTGNFFSLRTTYLQHLRALEDRGLLASGPLLVIRLKFWMDGSTVGTLPMLQGSTGILRSSTSIPPKASPSDISFICKRHIFFKLPMEECEDSMDLLRKHLAQEIASLQKPLEIQSGESVKSVEIRVGLVSPDTKSARLACGVTAGGYFGCTCCYGHADHYINYPMMVRIKKRDWRGTYLRVLELENGEYSAFHFGDVHVPIWVDPSDKNHDPFYGTDTIEVGCEFMHIVEGVSKPFYDRIVGTMSGSASRSECYELVSRLLNVSSGEMTTMISARNWRELWLLGKMWIQSHFWSDPRKSERIKQFCGYFADLIHLCYTQTPPSSVTVLRVYVLCFLFCKEVRDLFPDIFLNHLHQLDQHVPFLARRYWLFDTQSEKEESFFRLDRAVERDLSNHQGGEIRRMITRSYFRDLRDQISAPSAPQANSLVLRVLERQSREKYPNIVFSKSIVETIDFRYFLWTIRDFQEGLWYHFNLDGSCTFFVGDMDEKSIPSEPKFYWGTTTSAQTTRAMDELWEKIAANHPNSYSVRMIRSIDVSPLDPLAALSYRDWTCDMLSSELRRRKRECRVGDDRAGHLRVTGEKGDLVKRLQYDDEILRRREETALRVRETASRKRKRGEDDDEDFVMCYCSHCAANSQGMKTCRLPEPVPPQ